MLVRSRYARIMMMMNCGKANMSNFRRIFLSSTGSMYISISPTADNGLALVSSGTFILSGLSIFGEDEDGYRSRTWKEANGFDWYEKIGTQIYDLGVKSRVVVSVGTPFRLQSEPLGRMLMNEDKRIKTASQTGCKDKRCIIHIGYYAV